MSDVVMRKWIPCAERMPEDQTAAIVTTNKGVVLLCMYCGANMYGNNVWKSLGGEWRFWDDEILAWMELPEPYKEK